MGKMKIIIIVLISVILFLSAIGCLIHVDMVDIGHELHKMRTDGYGY